MKLLLALISLIPFVSAAPAQDSQSTVTADGYRSRMQIPINPSKSVIHGRNTHIMNGAPHQGQETYENHDSFFHVKRDEHLQSLDGTYDGTYNDYLYPEDSYEQEQTVYDEPMSEEMIVAMEKEEKELEKEEKELGRKGEAEAAKLEDDVRTAVQTQQPQRRKKNQPKEGVYAQPKKASTSNAQYPSYNYYGYPQSSTPQSAYQQYPAYNQQQPYAYPYPHYSQPSTYHYGYTANPYYNNPYAYNYNPNSYYAQQAAYEQQLKEYERQKQQYEQQRKQRPPKTDLPQPQQLQPPKPVAPKQQQQQPQTKPQSQGKPNHVSYMEYEDYPESGGPTYNLEPTTYASRQPSENSHVSTANQPEKFRAPKYDIQDMKNQYIRKKPHRSVNKNVVTSDDRNESFEPLFNHDSAANKLLSKPGHLDTAGAEWVANE